jgi:hypothetical protein
VVIRGDHFASFPVFTQSTHAAEVPEALAGDGARARLSKFVEGEARTGCFLVVGENGEEKRRA